MTKYGLKLVISSFLNTYNVTAYPRSMWITPNGHVKVRSSPKLGLPVQTVMDRFSFIYHAMTAGETHVPPPYLVLSGAIRVNDRAWAQKLRGAADLPRVLCTIWLQNFSISDRLTYILIVAYIHGERG